MSKPLSLPLYIRVVRALPSPLRHGVSLLLGERINSACTAIQGKQVGMATVILSFDCDFPVDVNALPELCSLLNSRGIQGSFAVVGQWVEADPESHRVIVDEGHELLNHSYTHPNLRNESYDFADSEKFTDKVFSELTRDEQLEELKACHAAVSKNLGVEMAGCRLPHFGNLDPDDAYGLMLELGYSFSSSLLASLSPTLGAPFLPVEDIVEFPVAGCPEHPFTVFDTWHCLVKDGGRHAKNGEFLQLALDALALCQKHHSLLNLYFDPKDVVSHEDFPCLLDALLKADVRVTTYEKLMSEYI
ncbi:MAG: polysaccharide deacetylase family protein [Candidatus Latescibacterota bacterium]|nr:polysaccharide deacetylase family protein [Candidatus Latescibacterota bacterium]